MSTGTLPSLTPAASAGSGSVTTEPFLGDGVLYEVVDNEIRELPPMSARETQFGWNLSHILGNFALNSSLGLVQTEMLFRIDAARNLQRRPDVSYVSFERWPKGKPVPGTPAWDVVPDLAVEVVSPTNGANEVIE
jgi:Uma2 family endonuclease